MNTKTHKDLINKPKRCFMFSVTLMIPVKLELSLDLELLTFPAASMFQ